MLHKTEAQYRAESDANTLVAAREIEADRARLNKAKRAATSLVKEAEAGARAVKVVALPARRPTKRATTQRARKRR